MTQAIKVAILWHQHQPYYKKSGEFILPWVRCHATKDYFDLPAMAENFPRVRQTFNVVPSLLRQLTEYIDGTCEDKVQRLTKLAFYGTLSETDRREIVRLFFLCNKQRYVFPHARFNELFVRSRSVAHALDTFSVQDWRDLTMLYNLAWIGPLASSRFGLGHLVQKQRDFSPDDCHQLFEANVKIMAEIVPLMARLQKLEQIDISVTPYYHPILPLLIDTQSARQAMPWLPEGLQPYRFQEDARLHLQMAQELYEETFSARPDGVWPSEGSISDASLSLCAQEDFRWTASDEAVLANSRGQAFHWSDKYFPWTYRDEKGRSIGIVFRDHHLSDLVGFTYSSWDPEHAAADFYSRLVGIRHAILDLHGPEALKEAVIPVILDGENCWEYYDQNGGPFLSALYSLLEQSTELEAVRMSEVFQTEPRRQLSAVLAGSWINANFGIWYGSPEDWAAWSHLKQAREAFEQHQNSVGPKDRKGAFEHLLVAEGSDWFWWYGDEHPSDTSEDFDELFRWNLEQVYTLLGLDVPERLRLPIHATTGREFSRPPRSLIEPRLTGTFATKDDWRNGGVYFPDHRNRSMHKTSDILHCLRYGNSEERFFIRLELVRTLSTTEEISIAILQNDRVEHYSYPGQSARANEPIFDMAVALDQVPGRNVFVKLKYKHDGGVDVMPSQEGLACLVF